MGFKNSELVVMFGAFICIMLIFSARHPVTKRKIKEIWHGRVFLESEPLLKSELKYNVSDNKEQNCGNIKKSTKHSPECNHTFIKTLPLLITGTPRSGTVSSTAFLKPLKFATDSQYPKAHGMISWVHIMYSPNSNYAGPIKSLNGMGFKKVLHQRRNVLKSLSSIIYTEPLGYDGGPLNVKNTLKRGWSKENYLRFLSEHIPLKLSASKKYKGLQFWVEWQLFIKSIADGYYRVEDLMSPNIDISGPIINYIYKMSGEMPPDKSFIKKMITNVNRNKNHRKRSHTFTWEEIFDIDELYAGIAYNLSKEYGYE
jgi:hypothetical protein